MKKAPAPRPVTPERPRLMNEFEAAEYLHMSVGWLRKSRMLGWREGRTPAPPYVRLGRAIKYDPADLDEWINSNRVKG